MQQRTRKSLSRSSLTSARTLPIVRAGLGWALHDDTEVRQLVTTICADIGSAVSKARRTAVSPLSWDPTSHLLSRFTFGPTSEDRSWLASNGPDAWFDREIALARQYPVYSGLGDALGAVGPLLSKSPADIMSAVAALGRPGGWDAMTQLSHATLLLQAFSPAQMFETVVDLFANHLNVANFADNQYAVRASFDSDVIRTFALGNFDDMLVASARHPAMLIYLNMAESTKAAVNENYGRELLELHSVGLHYSENDVQNVARLLTGRTVNGEWEYVYQPANHPTGAVQVLGFTAPNSSTADGDGVGDSLVRYLAQHSYTATQLATKLCIRYVSDSPSKALISAVADAYSQNSTSILSMISTILRSTEFWESRGRKVRRPTENLLASIRALGMTPADPLSASAFLQQAAASMGNVPLTWQPPNGYPDVATAWSSAGALLQEWALHLQLTTAAVPGLTKPQLSTWLASRTSGGALNDVCSRLVGGALQPEHMNALQAFLGESGSTPLANSTMTNRVGPVAAVVLDSPYHALR